jgi:hypothetical protein
MIDEEGEALQLLKAVHEQGHQVRWLELKASTMGVVDEAFSAMLHSGAYVAVEIDNISTTITDQISEFARRVRALPKATAARLLLFSRCVAIQWVRAPTQLFRLGIQCEFLSMILQTSHVVLEVRCTRALTCSLLLLLARSQNACFICVITNAHEEILLFMPG